MAKKTGNLSPDEWVKRVEQMEQDAKQRAKAQQSPLNKIRRPRRQDVDDDNITTYKVTRKNIFTDLNWSNDWTTGDDGTFTIEYTKRNGKRYTFSCSCGNKRDDPEQFCIHRAYCEWLKYYNRGEAREYDELPDEWEVSYDEYKRKHDKSFSWDIAFPED